MLAKERQILENEEKSRKLAQILFPHEEWLKTENNIFVSKNRMVEQKKEPEKWEKEMSQARILTNRGSVAYFLPEGGGAQNAQKCADIILDGVVTEMKYVTGSRETLGWEFKKGYKQGKSLIQKLSKTDEHSVFIWLSSDLSVVNVKAKIAGELKTRHSTGSAIVYFNKIDELHKWSYDELRAFIREDKK